MQKLLPILLLIPIAQNENSNALKFGTRTLSQLECNLNHKIIYVQLTFLVCIYVPYYFPQIAEALLGQS